EGSVRAYEVTPEEFGLASAAMKDIAGGDAVENASIVRAILTGEKSPRRDIVLMNAAAALMAAGKAANLTSGVALAAKSIDSGNAARKLDALVLFTNKNH